MRGRKYVTAGMLILFFLSVLSLWISIPTLLIRGVAMWVFIISAVNNCRYYKVLKGHHSKVLWSLCVVCVLIAGVSAFVHRLFWQLLYVVSLYCFFTLAEIFLYGVFRKSYLIMGMSVIALMVANVYAENVWMRRVILVMHVGLLFRLLNPFRENLAIKGSQKRGDMEERQVSLIRKILFGRSGKLRFPGIAN